MSSSPRKKHDRKPRTQDGSRKTASNPQSAIRNPKFIATAAALVVFAGIPFALGKYFELNYPDPFDSGCYVYSAEHVLSGARIGYEEKPSAQAGTLLINMLGVTLSGFNETGSKVLQGLFQAAAFAFLFITIRRLYGTPAAVVSVAVASIYLSAPLIAKYGNVKEQFMIAFMIAGICSFVWYHLTGKWWWLPLAGALLIWGPMFKQTGMSAIGAVGLFTLAQPILHRCNWKRAGRDAVLLVAGAIAMLSPIFIWYASMGTPLHFWPYSFISEPLLSAVGVGGDQAAESQAAQAQPTLAEQEKPDRGFILGLLPGYVSNSWAALDAKARTEVVRRVLRYYGLLILPIALALGALAVRALSVWRAGRKKAAVPVEQDPGRFVPLFGIWWFFDMAFVWISPHTYEQYFLPLNASGAVLGGYLVGAYTRRLRGDRDKTRWVVLGLLGSLAMLILSWHIFFGIRKSPYSGTAYGTPSRGYLQKWNEIAARRKPVRRPALPAQPIYAAWRTVYGRQRGYRAPWEDVGQYIREHSEPTDRIYVWGWIPGIYVQARRLSSAPKAFEGTMHTLPPSELAARVRELLDAFAKKPPKFIVDTQNRHFPWDRPVLQLWPNVQNAYPLLRNPPADNKQAPAMLLQMLNVQVADLADQGFLRADDPNAIRRYDVAYEKALSQAVEPAEAQRYEALQPLREYVMKNYTIVGEFGTHILFKHK